MVLQKLGDKVPQRGNAFTEGFGRLFLRLCGWRVLGEVPDRAQMVVIVAPHTSNMDFVYAVATMLGLRLRITLLVKHTLFKFPLGLLMSALGCIPVDRSAAQGMVGQLAEEFKRRPQLLIGIAPEGTRSDVSKWKRGFALIAKESGVPVLPVTLDLKRKFVMIEDLITDVSDPDQTMQKAQSAVQETLQRELP